MNIKEDYPLEDWEFEKIDDDLYPLIKKTLGIDYEMNEDPKLFNWYCDIRNNLCQQIHDKRKITKLMVTQLKATSRKHQAASALKKTQ